MTTVGFVGLGKLGLPVALAVESRGHRVLGYDTNPDVERYVRERKIPYREARAGEMLAKSSIGFAPLSDIVRECEFVFMPIQTPHLPDYEGITPLPETRVDFDYSYLVKGVRQVADEAELQGKHVQLVVISTALPGTMDREVKPALGDHLHLVYNPAFIAMGTTIDDFLEAEFVLIGADPDNEAGANRLVAFYATLHRRPTFVTDIKTAELIKVGYNTFIGSKIVFANAMMEICEKVDGNIDDLTRALSMATTRIISPKYMGGGMGDGGGCHPRDNIAMSWLAQKIDLSHNVFEDLMQARQDQTAWLARVIKVEAQATGLPVVVLGKAYKPETNLSVGSPALLLSHQLGELGVVHECWDPYIDQPRDWFPAVYFVATAHPEFRRIDFAMGSVVIDPWRMIEERTGVRLIGLGNPRARLAK